jgi:hypothetical protein
VTPGEPMMEQGRATLTTVFTVGDQTVIDGDALATPRSRKARPS